MGSEFNYFAIPYMTPEGDSGIMDCTPDNTELFRHSEQWKEVDHVFIRVDPVDRRLGAFVWRHVLGEEEFDDLSTKMVDSTNYPHHYRPYPAEGDLEQYEQDAVGVPDTLPEDFIQV